MNQIYHIYFAKNIETIPAVFNFKINIPTSNKKRNKIIKKRNKLKPPFSFSVSVPNWVSLLTGSVPYSSGYLGNENIQEIEYDNLFRSLKYCKEKFTVIGWDWFVSLLNHDLPM